MLSARNAASVLAAVVALSLGSRAEAVQVDLELSLLVDVSGSVSSSEFGLQRGGYSSAFRNSMIQNAIVDTSDGRLGAIAVNFIYWSTQQQETLGWTLIDSAASANAFADSIDAADRPFGGGTQPSSAIDFATPLFPAMALKGMRSSWTSRGTAPVRRAPRRTPAMRRWRRGSTASTASRSAAVPLSSNSTPTTPWAETVPLMFVCQDFSNARRIRGDAPGRRFMARCAWLGTEHVRRRWITL